MNEQMKNALTRWATDDVGPVALHLKQELLPVESNDGEPGVIFPPTYANIGYNIDELSDGKLVALIDSVGSQANRLEPVFDSDSENRADWIVPQIEIVLREEPRTVKRSILDLAHRAADAVVHSTPGLSDLVTQAFEALQTGNAAPLVRLAPTSLVFGVWDSRGGSGEKRPRLVRSVIRAWDVEPLHTAAQFNSVWKSLSEDQQKELEQEAKKQKKKLSEKGFADAPAVFRKDAKAPQYLEGRPNPEARVLGGVLAKGPIERHVTVNLVALRALRGENDEETTAIREYLLALSLLAATADIELFLREGCHLRYAEENDEWYAVPRRGKPEPMTMPDFAALREYASQSAKHFRPGWPDRTKFKFDLKEAKKILKKETEDEGQGA